jgi:hypothetical protein
MFTGKPVRVALCVSLIILGSPGLAHVALAETFDKPMRETVVDLGPSPHLLPGDKLRIQLTCFYFQDFVIKELDDPGLKGPRWVTSAPIIQRRVPTCHQWHDSTERFLAKGWWSFGGIKGSFVFLGAADGDDTGGMAFRILDVRTGKKIFEDSKWWDDHLNFASTTDGTMLIRYLRVVGGDCSIPKGGIACWNRFRRRYGVALATVPSCTGYRHEGDKERAVGDDGVLPEDIKTPSAIAYPVEVKLLLQPSIMAVPGPVKCTPVQ